MPRKSRIVIYALIIFLSGSLFGAAAEAVGRPAASKRSEPSWTSGLGELLMRRARALLGSASGKNGASLDPFGQPKPAEETPDPSGQRAGSDASEPSGQ